MPSLFGKLFGGKQRRLEKALANIEQNIDPASKWKVVGDLGEGTFGTVHKVCVPKCLSVLESPSGLQPLPPPQAHTHTPSLPHTPAHAHLACQVKSYETGEMAAAKMIPIESEDDLFDYAVEADILTECPHEHIVGLRGAYLWKSNLWVGGATNRRAHSLHRACLVLLCAAARVCLCNSHSHACMCASILAFGVWLSVRTDCDGAV